MATTHILAVDDEEDLRKILKFNLEIEGYKVDTAYSVEEVLKKDLTVYNLLLLDVTMGEISSFKMAHVLRQDGKTTSIPIIFLTAKDTENNVLTGLNLGADDYTPKPFSIYQVIARVKTVLRRASEKPKEKETGKFKYEALAFGTKRIKVTVGGVEVPLTRKEFEILRLLLENKRNVLSREEILSRIWKNEVYVPGRTISANIARLRRKIGPYRENIITRLGFGYCFKC